MISLSEFTVDQVHNAYRSGEFSCKELVEAYLARIEALDRNGPKLNSMLAMSPTALTEAESLDKHLKETSQFIGPLHGIPVVVKDQADTKGITTTYGSIVAKDNVPDEDATLVKKLKDAGAVLLGKTTMPDWATSWFSASSMSGVTRNPYSLDRDPGGSSAGTGAAIAANFAILGLGEDTGGSIRLPAFFCSLVGLRCTPGLVSRAGMSPLLTHQDTPGPMCRTVRDAALMLDAISGFDPKDAYTATAVTSGPPEGGSYAANLDTKTITKARIGVLSQGFGPDSEPECKAVNDVVRSALESLSEAGTVLVDMKIPDLTEFVSFTSTYLTKSRSDLNRFFKDKPHIASDITHIVEQKKFHPSLDLLEGLAHGPLKPGDDPTYVERRELQDQFQRLVVGIIATIDVDAIAMPDCQVAAVTHEDVCKPRWSALDFPTNTVIASQARLPAITVPVGSTTDGLPVGLELVGLPYREQKLLGLGYSVEQLLKARRPPDL